MLSSCDWLYGFALSCLVLCVLLMLFEHSSPSSAVLDDWEGFASDGVVLVEKAKLNLVYAKYSYDYTI